jgi:hypothetical protein
MTRTLTSEAREFRASWRRFAVPIAFGASAACVALVNRLSRSADSQDMTLLRLLGAPLAAAAVIPATSIWVFLVRKIPWLDSRTGFVVAVPGCSVAIFFFGLAASFLTVVILWVFAVFPVFVFLHAYPGIVIGLVLPRVLVPSLRPDKRRNALAADVRLS